MSADTMLGDRQKLAYIAGQAADARLNVELETEGMTLNIGPQHPATHGTLRIICRLDGEQVVWAEPSAGYMHRGYEKLTEVRTFPQVTTLINRIDWLGSFANEVPFILAAEKLMEIEAPPRAQHIRTILFELSRIANVALFLGDLGVQMGAVTPVFMAFRDREYVLNLIEGATGGRFHPNFDRIGGLKDDLPKGWIDETRGVMRKLRNFCDEMEDLLFGNEIFQTRTRGVGVDPQGDRPPVRPVRAPTCAPAASTTTCAATSGSPMAWDKVDWKVWTHPDGDSFARCWVRLQETREATLDRRPAARLDAVRSDHGQGAAHHQGARGRGLGVAPRTRSARWATTSSARATSARSGSRSARPASTTSRVVPWVLRGVYVPDVITILAIAVLHPRGHRPLMMASITSASPSADSALPGSSLALPAPAPTQVVADDLRRRHSVLGPVAAARPRRHRCRAAAGGHDRLPVPVQDDELHAEPPRARWRPGRTARCSCSPRSASGCRKKTSSPSGPTAASSRWPRSSCSTSTFLLVAVVPFGPDAYFTNFDVGVFYMLAV